MRLLALVFVFSHLLWANEIPIRSDNYAKIFAVTRRASTREDVKSFFSEIFSQDLEKIYLKYKGTENELPREARHILSSTQMMKLFQVYPEFMDELFTCMRKVPVPPTTNGEVVSLPKEWKEKLAKMIDKSEFAHNLEKYANPFTPLEMVSLSGEPGYREILFYANIERYLDGKKIPADDLMQVMLDFFSREVKQAIVNVYDQDLVPLAQKMARRCREGSLKYVGIDKGVAQHARETNKQTTLEYIRILKEAGCIVVEVDAVNLNHQKLAAKNWDFPLLAKVAASSANYTFSGMSPLGDLPWDLRKQIMSKFAKANVNQISIIHGQYPAHVVYHILSLGLKEKYSLRGSQFPLSGAFKIYGPKDKVTGETPELYMLSTPKGGMKNILRNFYGEAIRRNIQDMIARFKAGKKVNFRLGIAMFAFSSDTLVEEIRNAVIEVYQQTGKTLKVVGIGDRPFAMREWSGFGKLSGIHRTKVKIQRPTGEIEEINVYLEDKENPLRILFGEEKFQEWRKSIKVSSSDFGTFHETFKLDDGREVTIEFTRKLHLKSMVIDDFTIHGSSLNASDGGIQSREQILGSKDSNIAKQMWALIEALNTKSHMSLSRQATLRNNWAMKGLTPAQRLKIRKRAQMQTDIEKGRCNHLFLEKEMSLTEYLDSLNPVKI